MSPAPLSLPLGSWWLLSIRSSAPIINRPGPLAAFRSAATSADSMLVVFELFGGLV